MDYISNYYNNYDEEGRLLSQHGLVEYTTTQKYIHDCIQNVACKNILEIGAGTGRYSVSLAKEGYSVTAVELVEHNIEIMKSKLDGTERINILQGNALSLSELLDNSFDVTLLLGPMYHLFTEEDRIQALKEAVRVTNHGGYILVAYCMNEAAMIMTAFFNNKLKELLDKEIISQDWHCISNPEDLFAVVRSEEIKEINKNVSATRIKLVATDGATNYMRSQIDSMDKFTFDKWVEYHLSICERQDLVGASNHTLDILRKN